MAASPTRRAALAAAAAGLPLLAAGCKGPGALAAPPRPAADVAQLRAAIAAEELMVARYQAALATGAAGPAGAGRTGPRPLLTALLGQHRAHLDRLRRQLRVPPGPYAGDRTVPRPAVGPLPPEARALLAHLAAAEAAAADRLAGQLAAVPPSLAQLLASISAAEATHGPALLAAGRLA